MTNRNLFYKTFSPLSAFQSLSERNGNMTRTATITNNHISFECKCGHNSLIPVTAIIEKFGREPKLNVVVQKARCNRCWITNNAESKVAFVGRAGQTMLGTATKQPDKQYTWEREKITFVVATPRSGSCWGHNGDPRELRTQFGIHLASTEVVFLKANLTLLNA